MVVCSGHLVDAPGRTPPRLPAARVPWLEARLRAELAALALGPPDLALTQGAAGSDLAFCEAALERGVPLELVWPLPRAAFIEASVRRVQDGARWLARFDAVCARIGPAAVHEPLLPLPSGDAAFEACNERLLARALADGRVPLLLAVWDGQAGGRGGTGSMRAAAEAAGIAVRVIPL